MEFLQVNVNDLTNVMQQYHQIKIQYIEEIVLFQLGDFYEIFFEDAVKVSKDLELTLTGKKAGLAERIPMCGIPLSALNNYVKKLLDLDYTLVVVDQVQSEELGKKLVERKVTQVISKGTYLSDNNDNSFIGALVKTKNYELSYGDISTGELYTLISSDFKDIQSEVINQNIKEIVFQSNNLDKEQEFFEKNKLKIRILKENKEKLEFNIITKTSSEKLLLEHLNYTQVGAIEHLKEFQKVQIQKYMFLSHSTQQQLELTSTVEEAEYKNSLFWFLNNTTTAMGKRLLKKYILHPLVDKKLIKSRQYIVEQFMQKPIILEEIIEQLKSIYDFERLIGKVINNSITPKEIEKLKISLGILPGLFTIFLEEIDGSLEINPQDLQPINNLYMYLDEVIINDAPMQTKEGNFIKAGFDNKVDELRAIKKDSNIWLSNFEAKEIEKTGIKNLKIKYNKIFGYFIEVTKSNLELVPDNYIRKQTMANCERYITEELKEQENKILNAHDMLLALEMEIYTTVKERIKEDILQLQKKALVISKIDVLTALAVSAINHNFTKPEFNEKNIIEIKGGRHPIVEKLTKNYIANDLEMNKDNIVKIITGPNMAGKSTYMRMLTLVAILGQIGSFVPAKIANLPIFDAIYTRIGASDNLAKGKSTFMVEMLETSEALKYATKNSLLIFDELGRGTSTYDGIALARSIIDNIVNKLQAKTLFSTHYHELIQLNDNYLQVDLVHVKAEDLDGELKFHHKVLPGGTNKSYGIEVAKLAGLDNTIISFAKQVYGQEFSVKPEINYEKMVKEDIDNSLLLKLIERLNINDLTPIEALNKLSKIKEEYEKSSK
ncbi:MAG: DNA mismatch repair protein MutS [Mycoplasmatales bacterium]